MDIVGRLAEHKTLAGVDPKELAWLAEHGALRLISEGEVLTAKGQPVQGLYLVLAGHLAIFFDRGAGRHKVMEWRDGDVMGFLPYSRVVSPPGDTVAQEPSELFAIPRARITEMIYECHEVTSILVHKMVDRARAFTSSGLHDEKMASLGKLSAGLAHELNNPAAAIQRSAAMLDERLRDAERATRTLRATALTDVQLDAIDQIQASCGAQGPINLTPIERAERADAIGDWLDERGLNCDLAGPLTETAVTVSALDRIANAVSGPELDAVLQWTAATCSVHSITAEIQEAASRISGLVSAVKGYTHMDQAPVAEPVELTASLADTVAVLRSKAREKSIDVSISLEPGLPRVRAFAAELNQIWSNLLDNALDAAPDSGHVEVTASRERKAVIVRVIDDGGGITPEVVERMFDPFFTTKPIGRGTGLGLDIVRRLVLHNDAEIDVETRPGRTEFRVLLPIADGERPGTGSGQP